MIIVALQFSTQPETVRFDDVPVDFIPFRDPSNGARCAMAHIDENSPQGKVVLAKIQRMTRSYRIAEDNDPSLPPTAPAAALVSAQRPGAPVVLLSLAVTTALQNGWDERDLTMPPGKPSHLDPSVTDWQVLGPAESGLTIAEMACCAPPPRWAEYRDTQQRPWECPGFVRPSPGWAAPTLPRPAAPVREPKDVGFVPPASTEPQDEKLFDDTPPEIVPDPGDESDVIRGFRARLNFQEWLHVIADVVAGQANPEDKPSRQKVAARARTNRCAGTYNEDDHNALWYLHQLKLSQDEQSAATQE